MRETQIFYCDYSNIWFMLCLEYFAISSVIFQSTDLCVPNVDRSWFHRYYSSNVRHFLLHITRHIVTLDVISAKEFGCIKIFSRRELGCIFFNSMRLSCPSFSSPMQALYTVFSFRFPLTLAEQSFLFSTLLCVSRV